MAATPQPYPTPIKSMMHGKAGDEEYYCCFGCSLGREIQLREFLDWIGNLMLQPTPHKNS